MCAGRQTAAVAEPRLGEAVPLNAPTAGFAETANSGRGGRRQPEPSSADRQGPGRPLARLARHAVTLACRVRPVPGSDGNRNDDMRNQSETKPAVSRREFVAAGQSAFGGGIAGLQRFPGESHALAFAGQAGALSSTHPRVKQGAEMNSTERVDIDIAHYRHPHGTRTVSLSASTLIGNPVVSRDGEKLGRITELMLDTASGSVRYAVLRSGGILGFGGRLFAVPWGGLKLDSRNRRFVLEVNMARFEVAPGFDKHHWPDIADTNWVHAVHAYYGIRREGSKEGGSAP